MNNLTSLWAVCVVALGTTVACGGNTLDGGSALGSDLQGVKAHDGGDSGTATSNGPTLFTAAQVAAAQALCDAPHGPVDPATTPADIETKLTGSWLLCSAPNVFILTRSLDFAADGTYYGLKSDGAGGLTRDQGIDGQGTWKAQGGGSMYVEPGPFFPQFETSPRRLKMTVATSGFQNWYVALGD